MSSRNVTRVGAACLALGLSLLAAVSRADKPQGLTAQTISLPSGPASLRGLGESFSVNTANGTGGYSVPLTVLPAILSPTLSLEYQAGSGHSPFGLHFQVPILRIYRTTDKGAPFPDSDRYAVSGPGLNDELVRVDATSNYYRMRNEEASALFVRNGDVWSIRLPNGHTLTLGDTDNSRQTSKGRTFSWWLSRENDQFTADHEIEYRYKLDGGALYIQDILYQKYAPNFVNRVHFEYQARPDVRTSYAYEVGITEALRCSSIQMFHGPVSSPTLVRSYGFEYEPRLLWSLLKRINAVAGEVVLRPVTFSYGADSSDAGWFGEMSGTVPFNRLLDGSAVFEDVNGDGLPDILLGDAGAYKWYENRDGANWGAAKTLPGSPSYALGTSDVTLADMNGDGRRDVVTSTATGVSYFPAGPIWAGAPQGFGARVDLTSSIGYTNYAAPQVKMADVNFDGRTDLLESRGTGDVAIVNLASGLTTRTVTQRFPTDARFTDSRTDLTDFNGDGVLDIVYSRFLPATPTVRVWYGLTNGEFSPQEQRMAAVPLVYENEVFLRDINRDGQTDIVEYAGTTLHYYLNDGNGRFTGALAEFDRLPARSSTRSVQFADMDGSGAEDIVFLMQDGRILYMDLLRGVEANLLTRVDNGMGAITELSYRSSSWYSIEDKLAGRQWKTPFPFPVPVISEMRTTDSLNLLGLQASETRVLYDYAEGYWDSQEREFRGFGVVTSTELGDVDHPTAVTETRFHVGRRLNDGVDEEVLKGKPLLEVVRDVSGAVLSSTETQWKIAWMCQEDFPEVTPPVLPKCAGYSDRAANKERLVAMAQSAAEVTGAYGQGLSPRYTAESTSYDKWGGVREEKSFGEIAFPSAYTPGNGFSLTAGSFNDVPGDEAVTRYDRLYNTQAWLLGLEHTTSVVDANGTVVRQSFNFYDGTEFVGLALGQATQGLVTRESAMLFGGSSREVTQERRGYNADGLVRATREIDANGTIHEVSMFYDEADASVGPRTNPTRETIKIGSNTFTFSASYDYRFGTVKSATDFNARTTRYGYDGLGRLTSITDPGSTVPLASYGYQFGDSTYPVSTTTVAQRAEGTDIRWSYIYSDAYGRTRLTKEEAEPSLGYIASGFTNYSRRGSATDLYDSFSSKSPGFEGPPSWATVTKTRYDALGRTLRTVLPPSEDIPNGSYVEIEYHPFETWTYDENDTAEGQRSYPSIERVDGLGRTREIEKTNVQGGVLQKLVWRAGYDEASDVVRFCDPVGVETSKANGAFCNTGNLRTYQYDSLGRLTSLLDPNMGRVSYTYDDRDLMATRSDALGQVQSWEYDGAERITKRTVRDASGQVVATYKFAYDAPASGSPYSASTANLIGRMSYAEFPTGTEHYSYDARGRQTAISRALWTGNLANSAQRDPSPFERRVSYADDGVVKRVEAPGGFAVDYFYNERRLVQSVRAGFGTDTRAVFSNTLYDFRSHPISMDFGNQTHSCQSYDARGYLKEVYVGRKGTGETCIPKLGPSTTGGYQHARYKRGYKGLITRVTDQTNPAGANPWPNDSIPNLSATYGYDRIDQLTSASDVFGARTYSYDTIQNLTSRNVTAGSKVAIENVPTGTFSYGQSAGPNAVTSAGGQSYAYDGLGRLTSYNGFTLTYDPESHLTKATKVGVATILNYYDAYGERTHCIVQRPGRPDKLVRYVFDGYEVNDGDPVWSVDAGESVVEISSMRGFEVELYLLDQYERYLSGTENDVKPLPAELMDVDGDRDVDRQDYNALVAAVGPPATRAGVGTVSTLVWRFVHSDQLTSATHVTDSVGDVIGHSHHEPYGARAALRGLRTLRGFAGSDNDPEEQLGLRLIGARYYAPALGRWITPDKFLGEQPGELLENPLEANLYSYAINNPMSYRDPSGRSIWFKVAKFIVKGADIAATVADVVDNVNTVMDPNASVGARVFAAVSIASEFAPIGVNDVKDIAKVVDKGVDLLKSGAKRADDVRDAVKRADDLKDAAQGSSKAAAQAKKASSVPTPDGPPGCFAAGTIVHTREGPRPIEEVRVGDFVWTRMETDPKAGLELRPVLRKFVKRDHAVLRLTLRREGTTDEVVTVTGEHPFHTENRGWVFARDLRDGDQISLKSGDRAVVIGAEGLPERIAVYNFEVDTTHTYFVGENAAWVHNNPCAKKPSPYAHLKDHPSVGKYKDFTKAQKRKILKENRKRNGGVLRDDVTGEKLVKPKRHTRGKRPPDNEAQVDHVIPRSKGGKNSYKNAMVRSRKNNIAKSDKL